MFKSLFGGRSFLRWGLIGTCCLVVALMIDVVALRYQYDLFPWGPRTVELNHGRFKLKLPPRWNLTAHIGNEYRFADRKLDSGLLVRVEYRPQPANPEDREHLLKVKDGEAPFTEIESGRFYRTLPVKRDFDGDTFDFTRHEVFVFDARRATWYLRADLLHISEMEKLPTPRADDAFFAKSIAKVEVQMKSNQEEKDEWATGTVELGKANEQFDSALTGVFWTFVAFFATWIVGYFVLERRIRLSKAGYTYLGQATTFISVVGILLAGISFFSTKSDYRMQVAQVAADSELDKALTYYQQTGRDCVALSHDGSWNQIITASPESPSEMGTPISCEKLVPYVGRMLAHLLDAREHLIKGGDFVDPNYKLGMPISLFIARAHQIAFSFPELSDEERGALSERCAYYLDPLDSVLRLVQSQQDIIELSESFTGISKFWGVMLAFSLALNMVKLAADRRFEAEKPGASATPLPTRSAPAEAKPVPTAPAQASTPPPVVEEPGVAKNLRRHPEVAATPVEPSIAGEVQTSSPEPSSQSDAKVGPGSTTQKE